MNKWRRTWLAAALLGIAAAVTPAAYAEGQVVQIGWLSQAVKRTVPLSYLDQPPADEGIQGARLGIADNATTGHFTGQSFELVERATPVNDDIAAAFCDLAAKGIRLIVTDLAAPELLLVADLPEAAPGTIFNTAAPDDRLRGFDCRANILHLPPSRAMLADALIQYLAAKRWLGILLVVGRGHGDREFAEDIRHAAKKYGARIVQEKLGRSSRVLGGPIPAISRSRQKSQASPRVSATMCSSSPMRKTSSATSSFIAPLIRGWSPGPMVWCRALGRDRMNNGVPPSSRNAFCTGRSAG